MLAAVIGDESDVWPCAYLPKLVRSTFYTQILQNIFDGIALATGFSGLGAERRGGMGYLCWRACPKHLKLDAWRSSAFQAAMQVLDFKISQRT
jgi:hypothetical protein